eukprot:Pgem_evm1s10606
MLAQANTPVNAVRSQSLFRSTSTNKATTELSKHNSVGSLNSLKRINTTNTMASTLTQRQSGSAYKPTGLKRHNTIGTSFHKPQLVKHNSRCTLISDKKPAMEIALLDEVLLEENTKENENSNQKQDNEDSEDEKIKEIELDLKFKVRMKMRRLKEKLKGLCDDSSDEEQQEIFKDTRRYVTGSTNNNHDRAVVEIINAVISAKQGMSENEYTIYEGKMMVM